MNKNIKEEQPNVNVKLTDSTAIRCEKCDCEAFVEGMLLRKVPKLIAGTPQDALVPLPTFACSQCGHVNKAFYPKGLPTE